MKCFLLIVMVLFIATSSFGADTLPADTLSIDTLSADTTEVADSTIVVPFDSLGGESLPVDTVIAVDTVLFSPGQTLIGYSAVTDSTNREQKLGQRPMVAMFKSMVLPGWGQYGNRRYIKAVFYLGLEAWMVGGAFHYDKQVSEFRRLFDETSIENTTLRNDYYSLYKDRKDERSKYTWFAVIVAFVSMFDAYVDAHLSGFPRLNDGDLTISIAPTVDRGVIASLSLGF
jgi:hypothetical protein